MIALLCRVLRTCLLVLFFLLSRAAASADTKILETGKGEAEGGGASLRASVIVDSRGKVSSSLRFEGEPGLSILGLDIEGDEARLRGALRLGPLVCGPGRLAGAAGFFSAPLSPSAMPLGGASFKVDNGLSSGLSLLALDLGAITAFALCRDGGKGFVAGDSGCATGLVALVKAGGVDLAFLAAASRSGPPGTGDGWLLEAEPDPGGLGLVAGLACESRGQDWRSTVGFGYSWGPLRGGGGAARFEGSARLGPLRLSLQAGYAAARFRDCTGEGEDSGAAITLGCSLPLWSGASFRASFRMECPSLAGIWPGGLALCDLMERSASIALSSRAGGGGSGPGVLRLGSGISFGVDGGGSAFLSPDLDLSGRTGASTWKAGLSGRWVQAPDEARASPSFRAMLKAATASSAPCSLEAGQCLSWEAGARPALDASLGLSLAVFGDGRISVVAEWRKLRLGVAGSGEEAPAPEFSLRYSLSQ